MMRQALVIGTFVLGMSAQSTTPAPTASAETTISLLAGTLTTGFAGSIVSVNGCDTTVALQCTDDSIPVCSSAPDVTITVTQGPSFYEVSYTSSSSGVAGYVSESCALEGPPGSFTRAICTGAVGFSGGGIDTSTDLQITTSGFSYGQIAITAGASKIPSGNQASCTGSAGSGTTTGSGGSSSSSAGAQSTSTTHAGAAPTGVREVYKVIVPVGAALMAGAGILI